MVALPVPPKADGFDFFHAPKRLAAFSDAKEGSSCDAAATDERKLWLADIQPDRRDVRELFARGYRQMISGAKPLVGSGAGGGTRTHTTLPSRDFKSLASTSSATSATLISIAFSLCTCKC
jgi:hypothetical protein